MNSEQQNAVSAPLRARIIGVGGAGCAILDQAHDNDLAGLSLAIVHTHARVLQQSSISRRVLVGLDRTHGLGTGGDAELARVMAEHDLALLNELTSEADLLFLVAGLGRGSGSGISPVLAKAAKANGALVIALVTTPFSFEGTHWQKQALSALQNLRAVADAVICVANEKLTGFLHPGTTAVETFTHTNNFLIQGIRGIWQMLTRPGLINVDFAYLRSVLRGRHAESVLAMAEARGPGRVQEVLDKLFSSPLLRDGHALAEADHLLVSIAASKDLTIAEIREIMDQLNGRIQEAKLVLGTAIDSAINDVLTVTLLASKNGKTSDQDKPSAIELPRVSSSALCAAVDGSFLDDIPAPRPSPRFVAPAPETTPQKARELFEKTRHLPPSKGSTKMEAGNSRAGDCLSRTIREERTNHSPRRGSGCAHLRATRHPA